MLVEMNYIEVNGLRCVSMNCIFTDISRIITVLSDVPISEIMRLWIAEIN